MPRVIVLDNLSPEGLALLESAGNIDVHVQTGLKGEALRAALAEADGAVCRSGVQITGDSLAGNHRLRAIVRAGAGTDNIDVKTAARLGIVVMNTPGGNTISTAEHTIALMMALARKIHPAYQSLVEGRWDRKAYMGTQLAGKTLGIVGLGRVGQAVAARAQGLQMRILGFDPLLAAQRAKELGIEICASVRDMLPQVDFLTVHTPLTDQTRNLIGGDEIRLMKKGVRVINCARGGILNQDALVDGLKSGHVAGVALDVYESEPCTDNPLFGMPGVLCTPHLAASTEEAQANVAVEAAELLVDFFTTGAVRQAVNVPPLEPKTLEGLRGQFDVVYRLGLLLAQLDHSPPSRCKIRYEGEVAGKECHLLSAAFAAGLLRHSMGSDVSIVNAEILLRERGIELIEERSSTPGDFRSLITAEVQTGNRRSTAAGTFFGGHPRLVRKDGFPLECRLERILLLTLHRDTPGVIGKLGEICGRYQVNIAHFSVGRRADDPGGQAVGVLVLDSEPPAEAVADILALGPILHAAVVHLPPAGQRPAWMGG